MPRLAFSLTFLLGLIGLTLSVSHGLPWHALGYLAAIVLSGFLLGDRA